MTSFSHVNDFHISSSQSIFEAKAICQILKLVGKYLFKVSKITLEQHYLTILQIYLFKVSIFSISRTKFSSDIIFCRTNFRHFSKVLSLLSDKVLSDKVFAQWVRGFMRKV